MCHNHTIESALAEAEVFARNFMEKVASLQLDPKDFGVELSQESMAELLQIKFLFPGLAAQHYGWLLMLKHQRQLLIKLLDINRKQLPAAILQQVERITVPTENSFMKLVTMLNQELAKRQLTALQKQILEDRFFRVPFGE